MSAPRTVEQLVKDQIGALAFNLAVMTAENDRLRAENEALRSEAVKLKLWTVPKAAQP